MYNSNKPVYGKFPGCVWKLCSDSFKPTTIIINHYH